MTATTNSRQEQDLSWYLQICADAYGEDLAKNNKLDSAWQKVKLVLNGVVSETYYYGFDERNGLDAAIYYNESKREVIVGIRGTEITANDGDVLESAKILKKNQMLTQPEELKNLHTVINETLARIRHTGSYKVVGQSLGGALASVYAGLYTAEISEVIAINPIG